MENLHVEEPMDHSRGVILYNRGSKCTCRAIVTLYTLRHYWHGNVTFFLEDPYPKEFEKVCEYFNCDVVKVSNPGSKALVRSAEVCLDSPYDRTMWLDSDVMVVGPIDEMFDYLDDYDIAIPHFAGWQTNGHIISKRLRRYNGIADQKFIDKATSKAYPSVNTGILSFRKDVPFMKDWINLSQKGDGKMFIPDETAFQVLYPSYDDMYPDMNGVFVAPLKFNVSVKHDPNTEDQRIIHYHGQKHVLPKNEKCNAWKKVFNHMCEHDIANITHYLQYADKRLAQYLLDKNNLDSEVTIVTACDAKYVPVLKLTFANWRKYKNIDRYPVIVFVHGVPLDSPELEFLRLPNVRIIEWDLEEAEDQRERMLSAFVFGAAEHVDTDYWLKLDADSYATNYLPLISEEMKGYDFCGHRWGYSRPDHIKLLDAWAAQHERKKLCNAKPMIEEGRIEGRRFYHKKKRTISFIQLHKTKFTKFCVKLLGGKKKLPAPTQDTFMYYVVQRFDPDHMKTMNLKKLCGFGQGRGRRWKVEDFKKKLDEIDEENRKVCESDSSYVDGDEDYSSE